MSTQRGQYGIDAPPVPIVLGVVGVVALIGAIALSSSFRFLYGIGAIFLLSCAWYLYATRAGKFRAWSEILDGLKLGGGERVLDLGCGRGAVLLAVADRLETGHAVGVDLWRSIDQSGNAEETTRRNAVIEGVADRVELHTGDMTDLPFEDASFDVVVSSLAIHNIPAEDRRDKAIDEAVRVLKPGGRLAIADISAVARYRQRLAELETANVAVAGLGPRMWWGGPWMPTKLVTAVKR